MTTAADQPKYDVAISFLSQDLLIATALCDALAQGLSVFFYPRNQEDLGGTDGMESMRKPFLSESRVAVILYRGGWGQTPWTRVEETAIKDRCLAQGWQSLFFMSLDKTAKPPVWLPHTHIRCSYEDFGLEQAVGAIKGRVQECGGVIKPLDALGRAKIAQKEAQLLALKRSLFSSAQGVEAVRREIASVFFPKFRGS
jgi:hypothetical protein